MYLLSIYWLVTCCMCACKVWGGWGGGVGGLSRSVVRMWTKAAGVGIVHICIPVSLLLAYSGILHQQSQFPANDGMHNSCYVVCVLTGNDLLIVTRSWLIFIYHLSPPLLVMRTTAILAANGRRFFCWQGGRGESFPIIISNCPVMTTT